MNAPRFGNEYYNNTKRPINNMHGWRRDGARYTKTLGGTYEYVIIRMESPENTGYGPMGTITWQVEINGVWAGTDPFHTLREAKEWAIGDAR
jgi:hypothetical protein